MRVCVCALVRACVSTSLCECVRVCVRESIGALVGACVFAFLRECVRVCVRWYKGVCELASVRVSVRVHTCASWCVHVCCVCVCA